MGISLCIITKNEENFLAGFLKNLSPLADEIIVADSSTDNTKEIAKQFTRKVFDFPWNDDFSEARNFTLSKAKHDWILWLDPDEFLHPKYFPEIKALTKSKGLIGYSFLQKTYTNALLHPRFVPESCCGFKGFYVRRICKLFRNDGIRFEYPVHETVKNAILKKGRIGKTHITIEHFMEKRGAESVKQKTAYYLGLLEKKKSLFPGSNAEKELEFEKLTYSSLS